MGAERIPDHMGIRVAGKRVETRDFEAGKVAENFHLTGSVRTPKADRLPSRYAGAARSARRLAGRMVPRGGSHLRRRRGLRSALAAGPAPGYVT